LSAFGNLLGHRADLLPRRAFCLLAPLTWIQITPEV
jgi:hypothetical protein